MKHKKGIIKILAGLLIAGMTLIAPQKVSAKTYNYNKWFAPVAAPEAYEWQDSIRGTDVGVDSFTGLVDLFYKNNKVYIVLNSKIIVTDEDLNYIKTIESYKTDEGVVKLSAPTSIFITDDEHIYIAEEAMGAIVELDENAEWVRTLTNPKVTGLEGIKYQPTKVVVDENGRIFVKAKSVYEGILELDPEGIFTRYIGANEVKPDFTDIIKRKFSTDEQISRMALWLPTDYSDITLDRDGFLMATVKDNEAKNPVRKLNSKGGDILNVYDGLMWPAGDFIGNNTVSTLSTIVTSEDGRFAVLDVVRNRIFVYAPDGLLLYILGGSGKQEGSLNSPVDICFVQDKIFVADLVSKSIEVFKPTAYGSLINNAVVYQEKYDYENAAKYWAAAYDIYPELIAASMGMGKQYLREENFEEAMKYFKKCNDRENYSSAYERVREAWLNKYLVIVLLIVIAFFILRYFVIKFFKKQNEKESYKNNSFVILMKKVRYTAFTWPKYVLSSPFKAFDDIKYENAGSTGFSVVIFILFAWAHVIKAKYTGFLVNYDDVSAINIPLILAGTVVPYLIFVVANWAVGTLIDGKANFKQVFKFTAYAMYPTVYFLVIGTILSNWIIYDERMFIEFLFWFPMVMFVFYCFVGIVTIHQFSFTKGVASVLLSFVAMAIIIFIIVLLSTMISQFGNDMKQIWDEFSLYYL